MVRCRFFHTDYMISDLDNRHYIPGIIFPQCCQSLFCFLFLKYIYVFDVFLEPGSNGFQISATRPKKGQQWPEEISLWPHLRPCLNEWQKDYRVKIKLISLTWQLVTLISWNQKMREIHSSPVMHNVEGKPQLLLEKLSLAC